MFEAYSRNKYTSTGVIQWMLNNAWPGLIWHLFDYYLRPGGGYFGAKKACEPLHPLYSSDDRSVWLVNSRYEEARGLKVTAKLYDLEMVEQFTQQVKLDAAADSSSKLFAIPPATGPVAFLRLTVEEGGQGANPGKIAGSNFYWLSRKPETLAWDKSSWYMTPTASFADFTPLADLPKVSLKLASRTERRGPDSITHVTVENPSATLAFFVRLKLSRSNGEEVLPVRWEDNYVSLLPGEKREVTATVRAQDLAGRAVVTASGWNLR
jgi:exo-1,4-beta-D-glucosaminidase